MSRILVALLTVAICALPAMAQAQTATVLWGGCGSSQDTGNVGRPTAFVIANDISSSTPYNGCINIVKTPAAPLASLDCRGIPSRSRIRPPSHT